MNISVEPGVPRHNASLGQHTKRTKGLGGERVCANMSAGDYSYPVTKAPLHKRVVHHAKSP